MPTGVPTDEETLAKFRAHYLFSGNASESARAVDIPESTGRDIAQRLVVEPSFVADRRRLRDTALSDLVAMRMRVALKALERYESETGGIEVKEFGGGENSNITITDKRYEHGKLVLEAEKLAQHLEKNADSEPERGPVEVHVHVGDVSMSTDEAG
jgi:hypothetical protein